MSQLTTIVINFDGIQFSVDYEKRNGTIEVSAVNNVWYEYLNPNFLKSIEGLINEID